MKKIGVVVGSVIALALLVFSVIWAYQFFGDLNELRRDKNERESAMQRDTSAVYSALVALIDSSLVPRIEYVTRWRESADIEALPVPDSVKRVLSQCVLLAQDCARRRRADSALTVSLRREIELLEERPVERHGRWSAQLGIGYGASLINDAPVSLSPVLRARTSLELFGPVSIDAQYRAQRINLPIEPSRKTTLHSLDALLNYRF